MNSVIPKGYKKTWIPKELKTIKLIQNLRMSIFLSNRQKGCYI